MAWFDVPSAEPVREPSSGSGASARAASFRARSSALRSSFLMFLSSGLGASFGAALAFGSSATFSVSGGGLGGGGCVMRGSQNLSRGLPSFTISAITKSRCSTSGGCALPWATATSTSTPACSANVTSIPTLLPRRPRRISCRSKVVSLQRVGDHPQLVDARLLHGGHDLHHVAVQQILVGEQVQLYVRVQLGVVLQHLLDVVPGDLQLAQEDALVLGDGQDQLTLVVGDGLGFGLWQVHVDAVLLHRRGDHEDDQQHLHDVDQRGDVDLGY